MITGNNVAPVPLSLLKVDLTLLQLRAIIALLGVDAPDDQTRIAEAAKAAGTTENGLLASLQPLVYHGVISLDPLNLVGVLGTASDKGVVILTKKKKRQPTSSAYNALYPLVKDKVAGNSYGWASLVKQMVKDHKATIEQLVQFIEFKYNTSNKPVFTSDVAREYSRWISGGMPKGNAAITVESILGK